MALHEIQQQILSELITHPVRRFSELKGNYLEGSHFMYHLEKLIGTELVLKTKEGYSLTPKGQRFVNRLSFPDLKNRIQPKIAMLVAIENRQGEFLLYLRARHPLIGLVGLPYTFISRGVAVKETAEKDMKKITGISSKLTHRGDVYITTYAGKELAAEIYCHIFYGREGGGKLIENSSIGKLFWGKAGELKSNEYLPGFLDIVKMLKKSAGGRTAKHFFAELTYRI